MSHSESESDFSNFGINLASDFDSTSKSKSESDFNSIFINLGMCFLYSIFTLF